MLTFPDQCKQLNHELFNALSDITKQTYVKIASPTNLKKTQTTRFSDIAFLVQHILAANDVSDADKAILSVQFCALMNRREKKIKEKPFYRRILSIFFCAIRRVNPSLEAIQSTHIQLYKSMSSNQWTETLNLFSTLPHPKQTIDYRINKYCFCILKTFKKNFYRNEIETNHLAFIPKLMRDVSTSSRLQSLPCWVKKLFSKYVSYETKKLIPGVIDTLPLLCRYHLLVPVLSILLNYIGTNKTELFLSHLKNFIDKCNDPYLINKILLDVGNPIKFIDYIYSLEKLISTTRFKNAYLNEFCKLMADLIPERRIDFVDACRQLEEACPNVVDLSPIIKILNIYPKIPQKWRQNFIEHFANLYNNELYAEIDNDLKKIDEAEILTNLSHIEKEQLGRQVFLLSNPSDPFFDKIAILKELYEIPEVEREEILNLTRQSCLINPDWKINVSQTLKNQFLVYQKDRIQQIINILTRIQKQNVLNPHFSTLIAKEDLESDAFIITILDVLRGTPTSDFSDEIEKANQFLQNLYQTGQNLIKDFSQERFDPIVCPKLLSLASIMTGLGFDSSHLLFNIWKISPFISPQHCQKVINTIKEIAKSNNGSYENESFYPLQSFGQIIVFIFSNQEIRIASHEYLLTTLQSIELASNSKFTICHLLLDYFNEFDIEEEGLLFKEIIKQEAICNPRLIHKTFSNRIDEVYEKLKNHLGNYPELILDIVEIADFIDPNLHEEYLTKIIQKAESGTFETGFIGIDLAIFYLFSDSEICEPSHHYLLNALKTPGISREYKFQLCEKLQSYIQELGIEENSPLQREIDVQLMISNPHIIFNTFNHPYEVYDLLKQNLKFPLIANIFAVAEYLDPSCHEAYLTKINEMIASGNLTQEADSYYQKTHKIFTNVFSDFKIRQASHNHLLQGLENPKFSNVQILTICEGIIKLQNQLYIDDDSPLFNKMIAQQIACNPEFLTIFNNPFHLYERLKTQLSSERNNVPHMEIKTETIAGENVKWQLPEPAKHEPNSYTKDLLFPNLTKNTLGNLFKKLEKRLLDLSPEDQIIAIKDLNEMQIGDDIVNDLSQNLLNDPYIIKICELPPNNTDAITQEQFCFFSTLYYIEKIWTIPALSPDRKRILSQGEDVLLKFSLSIQECPIGRSDRIIEFYQDLPADYRLALVSTRGNSRGKQLIQTLVQSFFEEVIASEAFLKDVTNEEKLSQASHVTLYLKNRLKNQLFDSTHRLKFDPHAELLSQTLIDRDLQTLLSIFFKHCPLQSIVQRLIKHSKELLSSNNYEPILELLKKDERAPLNYEYYFTIDEDDGEPKELTQTCALKLLKAVGFAKPSEF